MERAYFSTGVANTHSQVFAKSVLINIPLILQA
jgi:hypothetical protein